MKKTDRINLAFCEIQTMMDDNNQLWFRLIDLGRAVGYSNASDLIPRYISKNNTYKKTRTSPTYVNFAGAKELLLSCRKPNANNLYRYLQEKFEQKPTKTKPIANPTVEYKMDGELYVLKRKTTELNESIAKLQNKMQGIENSLKMIDKIIQIVKEGVGNV